MGRLLISIGVLLVVAGATLILADKAGIHLGRLPGDIRIEGKHGVFYFPVVTCILMGIVLSLILRVFR